MGLTEDDISYRLQDYNFIPMKDVLRTIIDAATKPYLINNELPPMEFKYVHYKERAQKLLSWCNTILDHNDIPCYEDDPIKPLAKYYISDSFFPTNEFPGTFYMDLM